MDPDSLTIILYELDGRFIIACRAVCYLWKTTIDGMTAIQWRHIYSQRTGVHMDVGHDFDWKYATVSACTNDVSITAQWDTQTIRMVAPCTRTGVRSGIVPKLETLYDTHGCCLDYVYDNAFRLRAIRCSCKRQANIIRCWNCRKPRSKRPCLNPVYSYYVSALEHVAPQTLNERLLMRVRAAAQ